MTETFKSARIWSIYVALGLVAGIQFLIFLGYAGEGSRLCGFLASCNAANSVLLGHFAPWGLGPKFFTGVCLAFILLVAGLIAHPRSLFFGKVVAGCSSFLALYWQFITVRTYAVPYWVGLVAACVYLVATLLIFTLKEAPSIGFALLTLMPPSAAFAITPFLIAPTAELPKLTLQSASRDEITGSSEFKTGYLVVMGSPYEPKTVNVLKGLQASARRKDRKVVFRFVAIYKNNDELNRTAVVKTYLEDQDFDGLSRYLETPAGSSDATEALRSAVRSATTRRKVTDERNLANDFGIDSVPILFDCPPAAQCVEINSL